MNRRDFLGTSASCAAHVWLAGALMPHAARRAFAPRSSGTVVAHEPWGSLERLSDRVWALISTPLAGGNEATKTFSNGGIVAGRSGVLVVEGFASDDGARWMADATQELTGRRPTHVVLSHYHGDHSSGLAGYLMDGSGPRYVTTQVTRDTLRESAERRGRASTAMEALAHAELMEPETVRVIDLGGARVTITSRSGHTASDLSVSVDDPPVVFGGDLLWNGFFPNYRDATPSVLSREVRAMTRDRRARYVPGHGAMPTDRELTSYVELLDLVEAAARRAHEVGMTAEEAAREFRLPSGLSEWTLFSDRYYQVALSAWEKELGGQD